MTQEYTPTHTKIMELLSDKKPHTKDEFREVLDDPLMSDKNITNHFSNLRKLLLPKGKTILCVYDQRRIKYRLVGLLRE